MGVTVGRTAGRAFQRVMSPWYYKLKRWLGERLLGKLYRDLYLTTGITKRMLEDKPVSERSRVWEQYLVARGVRRRIARLLAVTGVVTSKTLSRRRRAGAWFLLADVTRSERIRRLAEVLDKYPWGLRVDILRRVGAGLAGRLEEFYASRVIDEIVRNPYTSRRYLQHVVSRVVAGKVAKYMEKIGVSSVHELYSAYLRGHVRESLKAAQVLAAEMVHNNFAAELAHEGLVRGGEVLVSVVSALGSPHVSSSLASRLYDMYVSGDVTLEHAYSLALSYLNIVAASEALRKGSVPGEIRDIFLISSREEFVRAVSELALENVEREWEPYKELEVYTSLTYLRGVDLERLPELYREVKLGHVGLEEAVRVAESYSNFLANIDPEKYGFLSKMEGERLVIAASALSQGRVPSDMEVAELALKDKYTREDFEAALTWLNAQVFAEVYEKGYSELETLYEIEDMDEFVRSVALVAYSRLTRKVPDEIEFLKEKVPELQSVDYEVKMGSALLEEALHTKSLEDRLDVGKGALNYFESAAGELRPLVVDREWKRARLEELYHVLSELQGVVDGLRGYVSELRQKIEEGA